MSASIAEAVAGDRAAARRLLDEARIVTTGTTDVSATIAVLQALAINGFFEGDLDAVRSSETS